MVSQDLLEILRCPACVREKDGLLDYYKETWLICQDCGRKYPIRDDIPVMLIDEGDKWVKVAVADLPVPPTRQIAAALHVEEIEPLLAELTCGEDERAEAAAVALAALGSASLPHLAQLAASPVIDERWWALRALAQLQAPGVQDILIHALSDPEMEIRQCAALAITQHPHPDALPALLQVLETSDSLLAFLAGEALIQIGSPAVPALIQVLESGSQTARIEAARALATIADPRAIPALYAVLDSDSVLLEYWAQQGLEKMGVGMVYFKPN